jgi:phosphoribosyl-AMP cyclohydrolase
MDLLGSVKFDGKRLVTAVAQDFNSGEVLMVGYMNRETLAETLEKGTMVYFSRSRGMRWMKGESSGHLQKVREVYLDCDGDALLFKVEQAVAACHENYFSCFFRKNINGKWQVVKDKIPEK